MQVTKCKISKITEMELFLGLWKENYMLSLNEDLFKVFSSISNIFWWPENVFLQCDIKT